MMRTVIAVVAALAAIAAPTIAHASSCGGGGSSGGSSSSSSSSSDSGSSDSGSSDSGSSGGSSGCHDTSDVVGYRQCSKFGTWSTTTRIPLLIFEWGMAVQTFDNPLKAGSGSVSHDGEDFSFRVSGGGGTPERAERATAVVTNVRATVASEIGIYGAGELEIGGLVEDPSRMEMTSTGMYGAPKLEQTSAVAMGALAVAGFQRGTKRLLLGAEVVGGVRAVSYNYHSQYLACEQTTSIVRARAVLEARARASVFVSPMFSVGAQLGTSLIAERDWNVGVFVGGYTRAFASGR